MKVLKNFHYILTSLVLLLCVNVGFASTTEKEKKNDNQQQEGKRKSSQALMTPDAESAADSSVENVQEQDEDDTVFEEDNVPTYSHLEEPDTLKEESVSKYNFIFYFLYKFKYDGQESP